MTPLTFSTVLLVGGKSMRMGRDKALLVVPGSGQPLWQRQWAVLEALEPEELFWSGPPRSQMPFRAQIIADVVANAGPLAGLSASLQALKSDYLLVLAIDLPQMTARFLRDLLSQCVDERGAVIQHNNFFEPLAAVYPKRLQALAARHLAEGRYKLQDFIREAVKLDVMDVLPLDDKDAPLFKNVNVPSDLLETELPPKA